MSQNIDKKLKIKFEFQKIFKSTYAEMQRGWWMVRSKAELDGLLQRLSQRGIRERSLCKSLEKNYASICQAFVNTNDQG